MNANAEYKTVYEAVELEALYDQSAATNKTAQAEWNERIAAEQKRRQPRRKKPDPLDDQFLDALRAELFAKYQINETKARIKQLEEAREKRLYELADAVTFNPDPNAVWHQLRTSWTSTYGSQGFGMHRYAKGALASDEHKLKSLGFQTHIRFQQWGEHKPGKWDCGPTGEYQLWANCEPWEHDAATRQVTLGEAIDVMKKSGVNPLVYNPFLPLSVVGY